MSKSAQPQMGASTLLAEVQQMLRSRTRESWFRAMVRWSKQARCDVFFDSYPRFFSTSDTASAPDRLNQRHRALVQSNAEIISGKRVLDIASHDGRWSLAANKAGARYVLGIEARQHLIEAARDNMRAYGVPPAQVEFKQGDLMVELDQLERGSFDTVFCFGFLYHTIDHMPLPRKISRLSPTSLVIDTWISSRPGSIVEVHDEGIEHESCAAVGEPGNPTRAVKGYLSRGALELMLAAVGFPSLRYYNWQNASIKRWNDLKAYYMGNRITVTSRRLAGPRRLLQYNLALSRGHPILVSGFNPLASRSSD